MAVPIYVSQDPKIRKNHEWIRKTSKHEVLLLEVSGITIVNARQIIQDKFLETDADYFFMLDDDLFFYDVPHINPLDKLIELNKDVVGALYVIKHPPHYPVYRPIDLQREYEKTGKFPNYKFEIPTEVFEAEWIGGGCILAKREVIEKIAAKYHYAYCPMVHCGEFLGEDYSFCKRARDLGYSIWMDPSIKIGHQGKYFYSLSDYNPN